MTNFPDGQVCKGLGDNSYSSQRAVIRTLVKRAPPTVGSLTERKLYSLLRDPQLCSVSVTASMALSLGNILSKNWQRPHLLVLLRGSDMFWRRGMWKG